MSDTTQNKTDQPIEGRALTWKIVAMAFPLVLQNISQTLLGVVDTFFVSQISTAAIGAVGLATVTYFTFFSFFHATTNSTVAFIGRAHGENDDEKVGQIVWRGLNMAFWLSLITLLLPFMMQWVAVLFAPDDGSGVREMMADYLRIRTFELPFVLFSSVVWAFFVGRGDSRTPMYLAWGTVFLNIIFDWLLVLGNVGFPAMGVSGAAYASVLANFFKAVASAYLLWSPANRTKYNTGKFRIFNWSEIWGLLKVGLPVGAGDFIEIASFTVFIAMVARLGTEVLAANQIALQYSSLSFTFGIAISMAAASLVAQFLGSRQPETAQKTAIRSVIIGTIGMGLISSIYFIIPTQLISFFTEDPAVITAGVTVLRLIALFQVFDAVGIVLAGALNGAGDTRFTMLARTVLAWGMFIPVTWWMIFRQGRGIWGAWMTALVYLAALASVYVWRFRQGKWKNIELA